MQPLLQLQISQRAALVTVDVARVVRGVDAESIFAQIEDGTIPWAWDIGLARGRRELRIWGRCLGGPTPKADEAGVIDDVIGTHRETLRGSEIERLLCCSAAHVQALHERGCLSGIVAGRTRHIRRDSLAAFLRHRRIS
jgi:hypothetical protein